MCNTINIPKILSIIVIGVMLFCKKPVDKIKIKPPIEPSSLSAVVVLNNGDSKVYHADLTEEMTKVGVSFHSGDKLSTGSKGLVDVQIGSNSTIRIEPNSKLEFEDLKQEKNGVTTVKVLLKKGKLLANIEKSKKEDIYIFRTQSITAEANGTAFVINENDNGNTLVRVLEGEVVALPRLPIIQEHSNDNAASTNIIKELSEELYKKKTVVSSEQQKLFTIPSELFKAKDLEPTTVDSIKKAIPGINIEVEKADLTKLEEQNLRILTKIAPEKVFRLMQINDELSSGVLDETKADKLDAEKKSLEKEIVKKQEVEKEKFNQSLAQKPRKLPKKKEIIRYFERIEKISLTNGKVEYGSIIDQIGTSMIIVHTENGVKRIPMENVVDIIYNYKAKEKEIEEE